MVVMNDLESSNSDGYFTLSTVNIISTPEDSMIQSSNKKTVVYTT